jgi:hypothetical protein
MYFLLLNLPQIPYSKISVLFKRLEQELFTYFLL